MPVNFLITHAPLLLFLGAGASAPLGKPTTKQFVGKLLKSAAKPNWLPIFVQLVGDDLEKLLEHLQMLEELSYVQSINVLLEEKLPPGSGTAIPALREELIASSNIAPLRAFIEGEIINEYRHVESSRVRSLYARLFTILFGQIDSNALPLLPIFTTNYDPAIETFCEHEIGYDLVDGFRKEVRKPHWEREVFDGAIFRHERTLALFKMHGSADWVYVKSSNQVRLAEPIYVPGSEVDYQNRLIYPAMRKIALEEPYYTGYDYFRHCCQYAKCLLVIGYSFRDYDALSILRSACSSNPTLRIIVVSPHAKDVVAPIGWLAERSICIEHPFGTTDDCER